MSLVAPSTTRDTTCIAILQEPHPACGEGGRTGMTRQIASVAAPRHISCDILCIRSENIQRANTQNWIPLRLIDTHPYPKTGVLLQGRKTHTLGTANPHSIYPVHISILRPMQRVYDSVYDNDRGRRWAHPGRGFPPEKRGRNNSAAKLHKSSPTDRRSPSESPTSASPANKGSDPSSPRSP